VCSLYGDNGSELRLAAPALGCVPQVTIFVRAKDGRKLAVRERGNPAGHPVFSLHGTPGSREGPHPKGGQLHGMGVRLISYDRPGYGQSDRKVSRLVADAADDVRAIADYLGIERFGVLGRSGGGPHALACAALLPDRVTRACALVSLAPPDAEGIDWFAGMADSNVMEHRTAATDPERLAVMLVATAAKIRADPASHVATLAPEMPEADRQVVADVGIRAKLARNFAEALRGSADGWIDDALAFTSPWNFDVSTISVPVLLWHGEKDVFSPVAHTRWLAERIPAAIRAIFPGKAHFGALEVVPDMLSWLIRPVPTVSPPHWADLS
jgi:pimeloyl-ACP methyl ester carboxylesterase